MLCKFLWQITNLYILQICNKIFNIAIKIFNIFARKIQKNKIGGTNIKAFIFLLYAKLLAIFVHSFGSIPFRSIFLFYNLNKILNKHFLNKYFNAALNVIGFFEQ